MEETIKILEFVDKGNIRQIESFARHLKIEFFLAGDIIMKEGDIPNKFYFIHKGVAEALIELEDFDYFNYKEVERFIKHESAVDSYSTRKEKK